MTSQKGVVHISMTTISLFRLAQQGDDEKPVKAAEIQRFLEETKRKVHTCFM